MRKVFFLLLLPFALSSTAQSESGLWLGADASYGITDRLGAELEIGGRLENDFATFNRYDAALGLDFKATKWLKVGAGYDFIRDYSAGEAPSIVYKKDPNSPDGLRHDSDGNLVVNGYNAESDYWRTKHRIYFDLTEKWKVGRFGFSLRERYQFTHYAPVSDVELKYRDELERQPAPGYTSPWAGSHADYVPAGVASYVGPYVDEYGDSYWYGLTDIKDKNSKSKHYLRTRLAVDYNIRHCPLTPFVSYEPAFDLGDSFSLVRQRVMAGFDWNLTANKQHALSVAYLYQHGAQEEVGNSDLHIISIGYKFSFDSPLARAQKAAKKKAKKSKK
ncbi:MAG: DUF2490 domain-containing protein [Bacteroidales bacterium]|nr:DUF2490 domain-containing protein [Bacteroidales bacterium]